MLHRKTNFRIRFLFRSMLLSPLQSWLWKWCWIIYVPKSNYTIKCLRLHKYINSNHHFYSDDIAAVPSKTHYLHFRLHANYTFFYLKSFQKKLADDQCFSITKRSIYHTKHMYKQPFTTVVDWSEMWRVMEVSTEFCISRYCVFTWYGRLSANLYKGS